MSIFLTKMKYKFYHGFEKIPYNDIREWFQSKNCHLSLFLSEIPGSINDLIHSHKNDIEKIVPDLNYTNLKVYAECDNESVETILDYYSKNESNKMSESIGYMNSNYIINYLNNCTNADFIATILRVRTDVAKIYGKGNPKYLKLLEENKIGELDKYKFYSYYGDSKVLFEKIKKDCKESYTNMRKSIIDLKMYIDTSDIERLMKSYDDELIHNFDKTDAKETLCQLVIDRLFEDMYTSVLNNIKEILKYNKLVDLLSNDSIDLYSSIIKMDGVSIEEIKQLYNQYKDINTKELLNKDYKLLLHDCGRSINDELFKNNAKKNNSGEVQPLIFDGQNFRLLIRCLDVEYEPTTDQAERECFTLIGNEMLDNINDNETGKRPYVYGYSHIPIDRLLSISRADAFTDSKDINSSSNNYNKHLMNASELLSGPSYNEIQILLDGNKTLKPDFVVTFDKNDVRSIGEAKRLNIPLIFIDRTKYKTISNDEKLDEHLERVIESNKSSFIDIQNGKQK